MYHINNNAFSCVLKVVRLQSDIRNATQWARFTWFALSEFHGVLISGCSLAAGISSEDQGHWLSETSLEQLLGHDQPRTNQCCYWPVIKTTGVGHSFSVWMHWASFACSRLFSTMTALKMSQLLTFFQYFTCQLPTENI